jgi:hypothetical protein
MNVGEVLPPQAHIAMARLVGEFPVGSIWCHYRVGDLYKIVGHAMREQDMTPLIVYRRLGDLVPWARPASEWLEQVGEDNQGMIRRYTLVYIAIS